MVKSLPSCFNTCVLSKPNCKHVYMHPYSKDIVFHVDKSATMTRLAAQNIQCTISEPGTGQVATSISSRCSWTLWPRRFFSKHPRRVFLEHQRHLATQLYNRDFSQRTDPLMLYWEMGSGKTLGILHALLHAAVPPRRLVIVCAVTMVDYWLDNVLETECKQPIDIHIVGYDYFLNKFTMDKDCVCVVDEAHGLRNRTTRMQKTIDKIQLAQQLFLLTGTPLLNEPSEVLLWAQLFGMPQENVDHIKTSTEAAGFLSDRLKVMYYRPSSKNDAHFPTVERETVEIPMHWFQALYYFKYMSGYVVFGDHEFQSSHRNQYQSQSKQICNGVHVPSSSFLSPKIDFLMNAFLTSQYPFPWVIYSGYLETGVDEMHERLVGHNRSIKKITGATDTEGRQQTVCDYNSGLVDVLLLSQVGSEGINLMGTGTFFLSTRHANDAAAAQTQSRVIRYNSHKRSIHKVVKIVDLIMQFPIESPSEIEYAMMAEDPWMASQQIGGKEIHSILQQKIIDADNLTVEQRMHRDNIKKTESLAPWLTAFKTLGSQWVTIAKEEKKNHKKKSVSFKKHN